MTANPTIMSYTGLQAAYEFFNTELFGGQLPNCLITLVNKRGAYGYFAAGRFGHKDQLTDEIALNPAHFEQRFREGKEITDQVEVMTDVLSTLVHEQCHLWQQHFGKAPRRCYHDKQWAAKMEEVGLIPSTTGAPGGARTGQKCSHYIKPCGSFEVACAKFLSGNSFELYQDQWSKKPSVARERSKASKTKYTCPECGANCWAKPMSNFICGGCDQAMEEAG